MSAPANPIRVLVVDDSAFMSTALGRMIESDPALQVIDTASNGAEDVEKAVRLRPDVITMRSPRLLLSSPSAARPPDDVRLKSIQLGILSSSVRRARFRRPIKKRYTFYEINSSDFHLPCCNQLMFSAIQLNIAKISRSGHEC